MTSLDCLVSLTQINIRNPWHHLCTLITPTSPGQWTTTAPYYGFDWIQPHLCCQWCGRNCAFCSLDVQRRVSRCTIKIGCLQINQTKRDITNIRNRDIIGHKLRHVSAFINKVLEKFYFITVVATGTHLPPLKTSEQGRTYSGFETQRRCH